MKRIFSFLMSVVLLVVVGRELCAQTLVQIGEAKIVVQSPIRVDKQDSLNIKDRHNYRRFNSQKRYSGYSTKDFFIGTSSMLPIEDNNKFDMYYGDVFNLEFGYKYFYRVSKRYAVGSTLQYSFYNYKLKGAAQNDYLGFDVPGSVRKEYFRTDNIGTSFINRFYLFPINKRPISLDLGVYTDFSFSRRYVVKSTVGNDNRKSKFKDGSKFNPLQAGIYGAVSKGDISVFMRCRLTNLFNKDQVAYELARYSIGVQYSL